MQTKKLLMISILAALLVCSAFSVAVAQDQTTPTSPPTSDDTVTSTDNSHTPVEDNQSALGVGDLAPIYEHDGEPAFGINEDEDNPTLTGAEDAKLYGAGIGTDSSADITWIIPAIGVVLAVAAGGVIGVVYFRKHAKTEN